MKILMVSKVPTHRTTAGNRFLTLALAGMLENLGCEVHFLYVQELPLRRDRLPSYQADLEETKEFWGDRFYLFNVPSLQKAWFNVLYRFREAFCDYTERIDDNYPCGLAGFVNKLDSRHHFDAVFVNYYYLTRLLPDVGIPVKALITHDYFAYKDKVVGKRLLHLTAHDEARAAWRAENIFAVQDDEASYYRLISPRSRIYDIYCVYDYHSQPITGNRDMVFLSGDNEFNVNGIEWFIDVVFPLVRKRFPDSRLVVGGSICDILSGRSLPDGVVLHGYVDDPGQFYTLSDVAINPVYQGTGLKIKTFEAVSYGKVVLVHPHSARGIFKPSTAPLIVCDAPDGWVSSLEAIWGDSNRVALIKKADEEYIIAMREHIESECRRFLADSMKS